MLSEMECSFIFFTSCQIKHEKYTDSLPENDVQKKNLIFFKLSMAIDLIIINLKY